jgi:hypothetical protein
VGGTDDVDHISASYLPVTNDHLPATSPLRPTAPDMSGYYPPHQHNPPQHYNANSNPIPNPNIPNVPTMMILDGSYAHAVPESPVYGLPGQYPSFGDPSMQQAYLDQYEDVPGNMGTSQNSNARTRRRGGTSENVKHRRTRSGCYTCRQRRVKVNLRTS